VVVPNGYDLSLFTNSSQSRLAFRKEIGLDDSVPLIGIVARWHPDKDHRTFLQSLEIVLQSFPKTRVLLVGSGMEANNEELVELLDEYEVREECLLLGQRNDIPALMNAIDLHVLSSSTEAFPNVLAEAMSCGTPCVSTDVGDAKEIVGDTGWVVPRRAPVELAEALIDAVGSLYSPSFEERRKSARERIVSKFSIESMIDAFHGVWFSVEGGSEPKVTLD
jgi:glycosyltransferase involved in cell wall biosynthesis